MPRAPRPLTALLLAAALGWAVPAAADTVTAETVVASVGGTDITLGHMIVMRAQLPPDYQALPDDVLYGAVLDQLIRQEAVAQSIEGGLSKGAELALENERRSFLAGEALAAVADAAVTETAVAEAYAAQFADIAPEAEFNASHILVETREAAQEIRDALDGGADFATLAQERSVGPSGPNGGALGWFGPGMMVKPFEDAVLAMQAGQVAGPVETQFGWHVIRLNETRLKEAPSLDEVRGELEQALRRQAIEARMEALTEAADITRNEAVIDPATLRDMSLVGN